MNKTTGPRGARGSLLGACLLLSATFLVAFPGIGFYGHSHHGMNGVWAAIVAGSICWAGAMAALLLVGLMRGGPQVIHGALLGMLFRMGLPLLVGILLTERGGPLAEAGVFGMIVVYYLIGLLVETLLSVRLIGSSTGNVVKAS